jgi:hypothetical protein
MSLLFLAPTILSVYLAIYNGTTISLYMYPAPLMYGCQLLCRGADGQKGVLLLPEILSERVDLVEHEGEV